MPSGGQYEEGSQEFIPPVILLGFGRVTSSLSIDVWMEAISERDAGDDAREGTITAWRDASNMLSQ
jgi:hypothetical protein